LQILQTAFLVLYFTWIWGNRDSNRSRIIQGAVGNRGWVTMRREKEREEEALKALGTEWT
jgi:hypothetical protein